MTPRDRILAFTEKLTRDAEKSHTVALQLIEWANKDLLNASALKALLPRLSDVACAQIVECWGAGEEEKAS